MEIANNIVNLLFILITLLYYEKQIADRMTQEKEFIYQRRHYLINQYDPAKIKMQAKELQRQYLQQQIEERMAITDSIFQKRAKWAAKPSPYQADQLNLIVYKRRSKIPQAEWDPCLQVMSAQQKRQQMLHDQNIRLDGYTSNKSSRPKSCVTFDVAAVTGSPRCTKSVCAHTPNRQQIPLGHSIMTPQLRPRTGLGETVQFHTGKTYSRLYE